MRLQFFISLKYDLVNGGNRSRSCCTDGSQLIRCHLRSVKQQKSHMPHLWFPNHFWSQSSNPTFSDYDLGATLKKLTTSCRLPAQTMQSVRNPDVTFTSVHLNLILFEITVLQVLLPRALFPSSGYTTPMRLLWYNWERFLKKGCLEF